MTWESRPITDEEYHSLAKKAVFTSSNGWFLSPADVIGFLECGASKALRYKSIVIARLNRDFPRGPINKIRITDADFQNGKEIVTLAE